MANGSDRTDPTIVERIGRRVAATADRASTADHRDPAFIEAAMPGLGRALRWFAPEVTGFEHLPENGPMLIVGNHSGGLYMPDYWAFLHEWVKQRGADDPLYSLGLDLIFSLPGAGERSRRMGCVPASRENAERFLAEGASVLVYPGGDEEDYRPWRERNTIDLRHHDGFVRLALRMQVPVVPLVAHGSHNSMIVVARGDELAHRLGLDRLRVHVLPFVIGPFGPAPLPVAGPPFPAKVLSRICEPFDWTHLGPEAADDQTIVDRCYDEVQERMQANLDELVEQVPHPVRARIGQALGLRRR